MTSRAGTPRFSVVVPAYNAGATIAETLDALLAQEFGEWECVVVDDGSTDDTASIAETYGERDDRFHLIRQPNAGTAGAYATGLDAARGGLLVICAADDMLLPPHLRVMNELVERDPEFEIYSSNGEYLYQWSGDRRTVYSDPEWQCERSLTFDDVIRGCFFSVGAVFRRSVLELTGGHRLGVYADDYDLWLRAMVRGARHLYTPQVLSVHRVSDTQQTANLVRLLESNIEVYEHLLADAEAPPKHPGVIEESIARNRALIEEAPVALAMEQQSRALRTKVEAMVGPRLAGPALSAIHAVSWAARPLRRALIRRRVG